MTPRILYEDNHLLVAVKPHMLPSQADSSGDEDMLTRLKAYVKEKYNKPGEVYLGLVHRLDRPTGGVMVFARTSKAAARLSQQIRTNQMQKTYLAVVNGRPPKEGQLEDWLVKDVKTNTVRVGTPAEGKHALLSYRVLEQQADKSLVEVQLHTGRSHQIRVQFASRGWPLLGDARYGKAEGRHLALFAWKLELTHPTKKESMVFTALPGDEHFGRFSAIQKLGEN
ncbi:MAG: RluA family pseudouridine synthase [Christensenellaceae bacterium]|nr:RluA family pseudouridine synthase [Christensenellaceae bacterium]